MGVRIPLNPKSAQAQPLREAVERAATEAGIDSHKMAIYMTHFLEQMVTQFCRGRVIVIPGFGMFCPAPYKPERYGLNTKVHLYFVPSAHLKHEVRQAPKKMDNWEAFRRYVRSATKGSAPYSYNSPPAATKSMQRMRQSIENDRRRCGKDL